MRRRRLLEAISLSIPPVGGCVRPEPAPERTETRSMPAISITVQNDTTQRQRVLLSVVSGETTVFDGTVACPAAGTRSADPGIERAGEYDLRVAVTGGTTTTSSFTVDAPDSRARSKLLVSISAADNVELTKT